MTSTEQGGVSPIVATDPGSLAAFFAAIEDQRELALDTESNSMHAYAERLCLMQFAWGDWRDPRLGAIDPLAFSAATPITDLLAPLVSWWSRPGAVVVAHGASYDIAILKRDLGVAPDRLFDTQIAATLLGIARTGYASLAEQFLDLKLAKTWQQYDWGHRPVDPRAFAYALDDARHVLRLAEILRGQVAAMGIEEEVELACAAVLETPSHAPRPASETFWRLARSGRKTEPVPVLQRFKVILDWREGVAESIDFPSGRVVNNALALELGRRPPASHTDWRRRLPSRVPTEAIETVIAALENLDPKMALPPRPADGVQPHEITKEREKALKRWRDGEATNRKIGVQAILPTPTLSWLAERGLDGLEGAPQMGHNRLQRYRGALEKILR